MNATENKKANDINSLELWVLKPYQPLLGEVDSLTVKKLTFSLEMLRKTEMYSEAFDASLDDIEVSFSHNKLSYSYIERRQVERAIKRLKGFPSVRIIGKLTKPVYDNTIKPAVKRAVIPATRAVQGFFTGLFGKSDSAKK